MDYKTRYNKSTTHHKYADSLINLSEKFYFAAFMIPIAIFLKVPLSLNTFAYVLLAIIVLGGIGVVFLKKGLRIHDSIEEK